MDIVKLTYLAIRCFAFALCGMVAHAQEISPRMTRQKFQLVVHGGAGTIERSQMTPEKEPEYRAGIENALRAGREILQGGGSSLDAVEAAVRVLEDDPHFNAGKGSVNRGDPGNHDHDQLARSLHVVYPIGVSTKAFVPTLLHRGGGFRGGMS